MDSTYKAWSAVWSGVGANGTEYPEGTNPELFAVGTEVTLELTITLKDGFFAPITRDQAIADDKLPSGAEGFITSVSEDGMTATIEITFTVLAEDP